MSLISNRKASFNYELLEKYEAGLELLGIEVKSLKAGHGSLEGAYVIVRGGEVFLVGANVPAFQPGNAGAAYDPLRVRKLLLTKAEIYELNAATDKGLTIVPISVYNKTGKVKIDIATAKGKKKYDKRDSIKKREAKRDMDRTLKS